MGNHVKVFPGTFSSALLWPELPVLGVYPDVSTPHMVRPGDPKSQTPQQCHHKATVHCLFCFPTQAQGEQGMEREAAAASTTALVC